MNAMLWIDQLDHFAMEHQEGWAEQKEQDQENALLNISPGSPVTRATPPGLDRGQGGSERSSCSDSPMSLGSLALGLSLALALRARTGPVTPPTFGGWEELPRSTVKEEEEMDAVESDDTDQAKD